MGGNWNEEFSAGICAAGGLMYCLHQIPLNISLDWRPMLIAVKSFDYDLLDFGVSFRYRFNIRF